MKKISCGYVARPALSLCGMQNDDITIMGIEEAIYVGTDLHQLHERARVALDNREVHDVGQVLVDTILSHLLRQAIEAATVLAVCERKEAPQVSYVCLLQNIAQHNESIIDVA
eukprot:scaffold5974_cov158-Ochromonas_danica.AAC.24